MICGADDLRRLGLRETQVAQIILGDIDLIGGIDCGKASGQEGDGETSELVEVHADQGRRKWSDRPIGLAAVAEGRALQAPGCRHSVDPLGGRAGGTTYTSVAVTATTDRTWGSARMRARACTVKSRGGPERGSSSPACVGSGAAGDTEMLARGPPSAIWESTRVCAVPATAKRADKSAVANVTAIKVRAARPGRRRNSRPAKLIASRQVMNRPTCRRLPGRLSSPRRWRPARPCRS